MSKGSDNHEIMTLNQQADAKALIKDIEHTLERRDLFDRRKLGLVAAAVRRYKEKWDEQNAP